MRIIHDIRRSEKRENLEFRAVREFVKSSGSKIRKFGGAITLFVAFAAIVITSLMNGNLFIEELMLAGGIVFALLFFKAVKQMEKMLAETA